MTKLKMNKTLLPTLLSIILLVISCDDPKNVAREHSSSFIDLQTDFKKWWIYHNQHINFDLNFTALDQNGEKLMKKEFFSLVQSGLYLVKNVNSIEGMIQYQLVKTDHNIDESIQMTLKGIGNNALHNLEKEGKPFPQFNFRDIDGNVYSNSGLMGKTVIVKCWFIGCVACIEEFPELNALVEAYKDRDDLLFLSLAQDDDADLIEFLKKKPFAYKVVGNQAGFMNKDLSIRNYPTHLVIGKDGVVERVFNTVKGIESYLGNQIREQENDQLAPPAPVSQLP